MTAGLSYNLETEPLQALYREKPDCYTTREFVGALAQSPLLFQPGEHWYYSLAHDVLAACVEAISGLRFSEYLKQFIFNPLDMKDVYFHVPEDQSFSSCVRYLHDAATGDFIREPTDTGLRRFNMYQRSLNFESGGAGLTTTVEDYAKFANITYFLSDPGSLRSYIRSKRLPAMRNTSITGCATLYTPHWNTKCSTIA